MGLVHVREDPGLGGLSGDRFIGHRGLSVPPGDGRRDAAGSRRQGPAFRHNAERRGSPIREFLAQSPKGSRTARPVQATPVLVKRYLTSHGTRAVHRAGIPGGLSEGFRRSRCTPRDHCGQVASAGRWIAAHLVRARRAVPASSEFPATARPPRTRPRCDPTGAVTRRRAAGGLTEPAQHQVSHRPAPSDGNAGLSQ